MKQEKSCGAVIFKKVDGKIVYLIEKMGLGHNSMCKGHVEENETELDTARREIKEETSLDVKFFDGFRETISYSPYEGIIKEVVYFLATPTVEVEARDDHDDEVVSISFLEYEKALDLLTYESDKDVLRLANSFIIKNNL